MSSESTLSADKVQVKRSIGLYTAISITVGMIVGSGIFITPTAILVNTGSPGLSLIIWFLSGLISLGGALCFAELATMITESGGDWAYLKAGLGPVPAFVHVWLTTIRQPASASVVMMISAEYILAPFFPDCGTYVPPINAKLLAVCLAVLVLYITSSTTLANKVLRYLLASKVFVMTVIVIVGIYWMISRGTENIQNPFEHTTSDGFGVALAFYSGLWSYNGWNNISFVTEEVKNVRRTVPVTLFMSVILVTMLYILMNVSYYVVIGHEQVLASNAVALDWAKEALGLWSTGFSFLVAGSAFGSAIASSYGASRQLMALAREGHTVQLLSMVDIKSNAPVMSLCVRGILMIIFILSANIQPLINFSSFIVWFDYGLTFLALLRLKLIRYNDDRDRYRVPIILPAVMVIVSLYLVLVPIISNPSWYYLFAAAIAVGGLIFYVPFVVCRVQAKWFDKVTVFFQLLFKLAIPAKHSQ